MSRRLSVDAKIVLERAGYTVEYLSDMLNVCKGDEFICNMQTSEGTVDNVECVDLLKKQGCDEHGYPE